MSVKMKILLALKLVAFLTVCQGFSTTPQPNLTDNIARGKPTYQSSNLFFCPYDNCRGNASRAVDGNKNPNFNADSCTHTMSEEDPWWRVDLEKSEVVRKVSLTNRGDCCGERLRQIEVRVGDVHCSYSKNPVCQSFDGEVASGATIDLYCHRRGRFLFVHLHNTAILTLCEVEVFVEKGASLPWTEGGVSCRYDWKWERSQLPGWAAAPVLSIFTIIFCFAWRNSCKKKFQRENQATANSSNQSPGQNNTTTQSQNATTSQLTAPMETMASQGPVSTNDNEYLDPPPAPPYSITDATIPDVPPPSYEEVLQSSYDNGAFQLDLTSINYAPHGNSMDNAEPPPSYSR